MLSPETTALVELLGRVDQLLWPLRGEFRGQERAHLVRFQRQQEWHSQGLRIRAGGVAAERKSAERMWKGLEGHGLVTIVGAKGRRTHVRFTPQGALWARTLCATGSCWLWYSRFEEFATLSAQYGNRWFPECFTAGCSPWEGGKDQCDSLTEQCTTFLPFATAGWLEFYPDTIGCYWLRITEAGLAAYDRGQPSGPPDELRMVEAASELYDRTFDSYAAELRDADSYRQNEIFIPFSIGIGWSDFDEHLEFLESVK